MLHSLFDGHPQVYAPPHDLNILYAYFPEWTKPDYSQIERRKRLETVVLRDWFELYTKYGLSNGPCWDRFERHFHAGIDSVDLSSIEGVLDFLIACLSKAAPAEARWLIVKETSSEMYAPWILNYRKHWSFLHLVRDPRDNYAAIKAGQTSYYSALGNDEIDAISSTLLRYKLGCIWRKYNQELFGVDRYTTTHFERIVSQPEAEMQRIADWMELNWDPVLCRPTRGGKSFLGNSHEGKKFRSASSENVGKWHSRISDEEAQIIEFVLQDEMTELGYTCRSLANLDAKHAGDWYSKMNFKYFFADSFGL